MTGCGDAHGLEGAHRAPSGWAPIEVIDTVMTRIEAVDDDLTIAFDFEAPWLSVVTARRPTRQIEKLLAGLAYR